MKKMSRIRRSFLLITFLSTIIISACNRNAVVVQNHKKNIADSISFIVIGDWGKKGKQAQKRVAAAMTNYAKKHPPQFIVTTGDNFYYEGVNSITDPHWKSSFENVYMHKSLQVQWYPALGNHDHGLSPEAQIAYTGKSSRWTMTGFYYTVKKKITNNTNALFIFTDTSPFVSEYYPSGLPNLFKRDTAQQHKWLAEQLKNSNDKWKIVIGHHPIYSAGRHGNTPDLIGLFKPMFVREEVDFYISGHDHSLQHLSVANEKLNYLVSGGGSESTSISAHTHSRFSKSVPGFLVMTLYADKARFSFYNASGRILYQQEIKKPDKNLTGFR